MRKLLLPVLVIAGTLFAKKAAAQDFTNAGQYLDYINAQSTDIAKKFLSYNSAVSHGKRAKKVENLRAQLIDEVATAESNVEGMPAFQGSKAFRDSAASFMKLYYRILNQDYAKIVDMEAISEQSYDNMEAYLLLQELVDKKLDEGNANLQLAETVFAASNNITLHPSDNDIDKMMDKVSKVNKYYHSVYLVFFRSFKEEFYMIDAMSNKNVTGIEEDKNALLQYAQTGLQVLDTTKSFEGDNSLVVNCKELLHFYISEVNDKMGIVSDYFLKTEQFDKIKAAFDGNSTHTKDDVDAYNKAVKDLNDSVNAFNNTNNQLNQQRKELTDDWNKGENTFFNENMPKYK
jgi:hypothetical protein